MKPNSALWPNKPNVNRRGSAQNVVLFKNKDDRPSVPRTPNDADRKCHALHPAPPLKDIPIPLETIDRLVDLAVDLTALHYHVHRNRILQSGRGNLAVSRARQVCMYLLHTSLQFSYQQVAYLLCRDRSTVAHACRVVEDLREDPEFEVHVLAMERILYPLNRMVRDQARNADAGH